MRFFARAYPSARTEQKEALQGSLRKAVDGILAHQQPDGGWNAWQPCPVGIGHHRLNAVTSYAIDPSIADVTGRIFSSLQTAQLSGALTPEQTARVKESFPKAVDYLKKAEDPKGAWWARWSTGYVGSAGFVLPGLRAAGVDMNAAWVQKDRQFLLDHQNADGGWGEDFKVDADKSLMGKGDSTPTQTALALLGLLASSPSDKIDGDEAIKKAAENLMATQKDGTWKNGEPVYTNGVNFEYYDAPAPTHMICTTALDVYARARETGVQSALQLMHLA